MSASELCWYRNGVDTEIVLHKSTNLKLVIWYSNYYDRFKTMHTMKAYTSLHS